MWQANGFDPSSLNTDPLVIGRLGSGSEAYHLATGSSARDRGRPVTDALRGMGTQDAFGVWTPQGVAYDIGAAEYRLLLPDPAAALLTALYQQNGDWQLQFRGVAGRSYRVETSTDLKSWSRVATAVETSAGSFKFADRSRRMLRLYRAVARTVPGN